MKTFGSHTSTGSVPRTYVSTGIGEAGRHHADDLERRELARQARADDIRRAAEPPLPQAVADHGHASAGLRASSSAVNARPRSGAVRSTEKKSAVTRWAARFSGSASPLPLQADLGVADRGEPGEDVLLRRASRESSAARRRFIEAVELSSFSVALADRDQPIALVERQPAQNDGVDDREDRRRRADAERQHHERDGR